MDSNCWSTYRCHYDDRNIANPNPSTDNIITNTQLNNFYGRRELFYTNNEIKRRRPKIKIIEFKIEYFHGRKKALTTNLHSAQQNNFHKLSITMRRGEIKRKNFIRLVDKFFFAIHSVE